MMVRQLLVTYDFPPMTGGIARAMGEIARHYPAGELTVSTGRMPGSELVDASLPDVVDRVTTGADRLRTAAGLLGWTRRAGSLARGGGAGFLWCGNLRPAGYVAYWLRRRIGLRYGLLVYGLDVMQLERQARHSLRKRLVARRVLGGAAGIVAISRWTAQRVGEVIGDLGLPGVIPPVEVVPLGADPERFRPGLDSACVRSRYGLDGDPWLLTVARLVPHKGIDVALEVVARLARARPRLGYAVVGSGPDQGRLQALAERLGIGHRVRWLGAIPDRDLPAVYNAATAYLGLSREDGDQVEGFGLSLAEAQASALPVVAGAAGGVSEVVVDGETGFLAPPMDGEAAALAMDRLLSEPALARRMGEAGRARVISELNWARLVETLRSLAARWAGPPALPGGR